MKTINEIKQEIKKIEEDYKTEIMPKKFKKHILILRDCIMYLQTNPNEAFVKHQMNVVSGKIDSATSRYKEWLKNTPEAKKVKNPKAVYDKEMGLKDLRLQKKTLQYLLN